MRGEEGGKGGEKREKETRSLPRSLIPSSQEEKGTKDRNNPINTFGLEKGKKEHTAKRIKIKKERERRNDPNAILREGEKKKAKNYEGET